MAHANKGTEAKQVQIVTDSRGKGLEPRLKNKLEQQNISVRVYVYAGASLNKLKEKLQQQSRHHDLHILLGGICNFTTLNKIETGRTISYRKSAPNLQGLKNDFDNKLVTLPNTIFTTVTPADLTKFYTTNNRNCTAPDHTEEQKNLVQDIENYNQHIKLTCSNSGKKYINLAKTCQRESRKRRAQSKKVITRFDSSLLKDGLHPSDQLLDTWAKLISQAIIVHFNRNQETLTPHKEASDFLSDTQSSEEDTGNFKRAKTTVN